MTVNLWVVVVKRERLIISFQPSKKGMKVKANGKGWKISNFQRGKAMTTVTLIEPNRVEE